MEEKTSLNSNIKLAVIGHIEWVTFISQNQLPKAGIISHVKNYMEKPAGGGAVTAIKLASLSNNKVDFFTALGKDEFGKKSFQILTKYNLNVYASWKDIPTRKGISIVDQKGDRAISIIGKRIQPSINDDLPWEKLKNYDGIFVTATDSKTLKESRQARKVVATPRLGLEVINHSNIQLDALIGSGLDPQERFQESELKVNPIIRIATEGDKGGKYWPGERFKAIDLKKAAIDSYGCGDSFAAGVTAGLASGFDIKSAIFLGTKLGADCATYFGPYK